MNTRTEMFTLKIQSTKLLNSCNNADIQRKNVTLYILEV